MNRLKERRLELGLTQEAVSSILKLTDPRMDVSMVSRFENGACLPTEEVMTALEAALRTSRAYLYGEDENAELPMQTAETARIACLIPKGRRNAISRAELAGRLGMTDRKMRKAVENARCEGLMILNDSDGRGHYQSDDLAEIQRQYDQDTSRAMAILKRRKPMRKVLKEAGREV
jgi:transcriptional regulator with XRE-family HTH domain